MTALRTCPFCAESVKRQAIFCRFCQKDLIPFYVDDPEANEQIYLIVNLLKQGKSSIEISNQLNEEKNFRVNSSKPWTPQHIDNIYTSFYRPPQNIRSKDEMKSASSSGKKSTLETLNTDPAMRKVARYIWGFIAALFLLGIIFGDKNKSKSSSLTKAKVNSLCKTYIAEQFYKSRTIMNSAYIKEDNGGHFAKIWYTRASDGTKWEYICHISNGKILWASLTNGSLGRWRYEDERAI
ncbi:hypothetical protein [Aliiglaciecola aliphaticivorans]